MFIHWKDITSDDKWPALKMKMEVKYETMASEKDGKEVACNVTDLQGGAINLGEADEHKLSDFTVKGTVSFFALKGFGFIKTASAIKWPKKHPAGTEVYVSREDLVCAEGSVCTLRQGMEVAFKVFKREGKDGLAAAEVTDADGEPLNLEPRDPKDKPMKRFRTAKGKGKGKGTAKKGPQGVTKVISKFAKNTAKVITQKKPQWNPQKKPQFKSNDNAKGGKIVKMFTKPSRDNDDFKIAKMGKGPSKGKGGGKSGGKPVKKKFEKIVYVEVPVQTYRKPWKNDKGDNGKPWKKDKPTGKGGKGGQGGKSGQGKGGQWKLVPKGKKKQKEVFW